MKATYIYLNVYSRLGTDYFYVGHHTWNGPIGKLDPLYHGSSTIIKPKLSPLWGSFSLDQQSRWLSLASSFELKSEILLLSGVSTRDEALVIEWFCSLYGVAPFRLNDWTKQFRQNGRMLNRHSLAVSPETHRKIADNRKKNGTYVNCANHLNSNPTIRLKAVLGHDMHACAIKRIYNQGLRGTVSGGCSIVRISEDDKVLFEGSQSQCDKFTASLGRRVSQTWLSKHPNQSRNGFEFSLLGRKY